MAKTAVIRYDAHARAQVLFDVLLSFTAEAADPEFALKVVSEQWRKIPRGDGMERVRYALGSICDGIYFGNWPWLTVQSRKVGPLG